MSRWWTLKGDQATLDALQRALDYVRMQYIQEEHYDDSKRNRRKSLTDYVGQYTVQVHKYKCTSTSAQVLSL